MSLIFHVSKNNITGSVLNLVKLYFDLVFHLFLLHR